MEKEYELCGLTVFLHSNHEVQRESKWLIFVRVFTDRLTAIEVNSCNRWTEKLFTKETASRQEIAEYLGVDWNEMSLFKYRKLRLD